MGAKLIGGFDSRKPQTDRHEGAPDIASVGDERTHTPAGIRALSCYIVRQPGKMKRTFLRQTCVPDSKRGRINTLSSETSITSEDSSRGLEAMSDVPKQTSKDIFSPGVAVNTNFGI